MAEFSYKLIRADLDDLLRGLEEKIDNDWVEKYRNLDGGRETLSPYIKIARNTLKTILFLCSDSKNETTREMQFPLATPPLTRTLLEILFTVIYLLENFPKKVIEFDKAYYREQKEMTQSLESPYKDTPKWTTYFEMKWQKLAEYENYLIKHVGLTESEISKTEDIQRFPKPGKIIKRLETERPEVVPFLKYLDALLYRELSFTTHLEPSGIVRLSPMYLTLQGDELEDEIAMFKSEQVYLATCFVLGIASEVESNFDYGLKRKLIHLWTQLNTGYEVSQEIYENRYRDLLKLE